MRFFTLILCFFLSLSLLSAQNGFSVNAGARGLAMGNVGLGFKDIQSAFGNQAGLAFLKRPSAILFAEQRFLIADINNFAAAVAYPTQSGVFALSVQYFGFEAYNEQKIGLAYGRQLFEKVAIGGQVDLLNTRIQEYGSRTLATFELGFHAEIIENLSAAGHIFSPIKVSVTEEEDLPTILSIGLAYQVSKQLLIMAELQKDIDYKANFKAGIEYNIFDALQLRAGIGTLPSTMSFGLGYQWKNGLQIDVASSYHQTLGFSPAFGLQYQAPPKK